MLTDKKNLILNKYEYIIPLFAIASLLISCIIISEKKYFWNDELYSYYFLADRSFSHMMAAFYDKINNTPPLYFLLGWLWARVFGSTELSLRLFSSLGICIAYVLVWVTLRRTYHFWPTNIGSLSIFLTSELILSQNAEARMYGLFLAICAWALLQFDINNRSEKISWTIIISNVCIHAALVNTHLYGFFYSGAIIFAQIVRDRYFQILRPKIYLCILFSWVSIIPYIPAFINQADAGKPRAWIPIPTFEDLISFLTFSRSWFSKIFIVLILIIILGWQFLRYKSNKSGDNKVSSKNNQKLKSDKSLLIFAYSFLAVPVLVWIISQNIKPIFWDRYMIPNTLSWSILMAHLTSYVFVNSKSNQKRIYKNSVFLLTLTTILIFTPVVYAQVLPKEQLPGLNDKKYGYEDLPIVTQFSNNFLTRLHYSPDRNRYFFILDWQAALDKASGLFGSQEYKHLDALKRNYPALFNNQILKSEEFLNMYSRFLVLDDINYDKQCPLEVKGLEKADKWENMHCPRWVEMRLLNNPDYKVTDVGDIGAKTLLLVEKQK
ncbi:MAG: glycosyltransferase family 39 protein [Nostoc sp. ChiQUE02]|uniref:glycosyltransferase family 39 protein n=1 Tax=Nostoc sp. ChiQUE02 TaxID=3075377 RepID=UPI002AD4D7D8|nr:glycosyltransferase family 39 protein [Nostoc sp. ChiQUE02]MDZ8232169.1 glycosyltransferase family 39 protein [Nostoc sp. ChiQUE02]